MTCDDEGVGRHRSVRGKAPPQGRSPANEVRRAKVREVARHREPLEETRGIRSPSASTGLLRRPNIRGGERGGACGFRSPAAVVGAGGRPRDSEAFSLHPSLGAGRGAAGPPWPMISGTGPEARNDTHAFDGDVDQLPRGVLAQL